MSSALTQNIWSFGFIQSIAVSFSLSIVPLIIYVYKFVNPSILFSPTSTASTSFIIGSKAILECILIIAYNYDALNRRILCSPKILSSNTEIG